MKNTFVLASAWLLLAGCLKQKPDAPAPTPPPAPPRTFQWARIADSGQTILINRFYNAAGRYFTPQPNSTAFAAAYWPNAHALDVLTDAYLRRNKDAATAAQMQTLLDGIKSANGNTYSNYFYDDMQWLLISSLRAGRETGDGRYPAVYNPLWAEVQGGWDGLSGGGFYWRKDRINKNTPANAPACIFAARLHQANNLPADLTWALNTYNWLKAQMLQPSGDVWDGLFVNTNPISYDNRLFTYNYGTFVGSALELYKITGNAQYQTEAMLVATRCITNLSRNGLLPPGDEGDGGLFNGIFVRYLCRLIVEGNLPEGTRATYISFLRRNAETMWTKVQQPQGFIGPDWNNSVSSSTLTPMLSGVMLLEAMAELERRNLL